MESRGIALRLVRTLVKALVVLVLAAGGLGGAALLGSRLFEEPPASAEAFAARVAAASPAAGEQPTKAERAYLRRLVALCADTRTDLDALEARAAFDPTEDAAAGRRGLLARFAARFRALEPPRTQRREVARIAALERALLRLTDERLAAARRHDSVTAAAKAAAANRLAARLDEAMRALGAPVCAFA